MVSQAGVQWYNLSSLQPQLLRLSDPPASACQVVGTAGAHHHVWLSFVFFLVEIGYDHVAQAGLELLNSSNLPSLASQGAEITV